MSRRRNVRPQARADLDDQAMHFERQQAGLGHRFLRSAFRTLDRITRRPGENARHESDAARLSDVRVCPVDEFPKLLVYYRFSSENFDIIRVLHGAQDVDRHLESFLDG